jgi:hypothetical protein
MTSASQVQLFFVAKTHFDWPITICFDNNNLKFEMLEAPKVVPIGR